MNETIWTENSVKQLLQVFGQKYEATVQKYLQQFHDRRVVKTKNHATSLKIIIVRDMHT